MDKQHKQGLEDFLAWVQTRNPDEPEFNQAIRELAYDVYPYYAEHTGWHSAKILPRLSEADRIITFRVCWEDDTGEVQVNRGWRVQHCSAVGPYKGGIRFHRSVTASVLKFLAFEQTFKNALTGLPIGGGKGGSDFDPSDRSNREIMRFCQAFMNELYRHIGENTDVPAGDINVGRREIGYLFGHYRRLANSFTGALTGKDIEFGGSHVRMEATGYGLIYFLRCMLAQRQQALDGLRVSISGAGNVALHAAQKAMQLGARVITLSSSKGVLHNESGIPQKDIDAAIEAADSSTKTLKAIQSSSGGDWYDGEKPWQFPCDIALPCATQNELGEEDARALIDNQCQIVAEGANMPCTEDATRLFKENKVLHAPGKASNAGGVALSGLEMAQNASFSRWEQEHLDEKLLEIMQDIHAQCIQHLEAEDGYQDYHRGANIAAFHRVANALMAQGVG
ncbi:NADP-specific glutamate dehydrogenase [Microbulbifer salipaludis]|uniref:Glutamate dehydrogenase n=1 Tax=Microbulbifer salipaludis TaxID=187980 RepID=A0ABS3EAX1_9GAMM|nr:NADP-specific glutamate dehydrogenase [Microbulbifer salipaludis]MBN8432459.1 NADP-specific glutamate dehydrogenase [Microbulbifer salipaludis]